MTTYAVPDKNVLSIAELRGPRVTLTPFGPGDVTARYVGWLNDPEVNRYSRRAGRKTTIADAHRYLAQLRPDEHILVIRTAVHGHVGNLKLGPVDWDNSRADISILIGETAAWGCGIGSEAIYVLSRHLFHTVGLNRLEAGSHNPAFLRLVEKLGWTREGVLRQGARQDDRLVDHILVSQLSSEFRRIKTFDP
jgi:[ribosomal protein S5]-alanine N-acetyltransferase